MSDLFGKEVSDSVKDLTSIMQQKQSQNIIDGLNDITKTVDDLNYLEEQKSLYIDLKRDLLDFDGEEENVNEDVSNEGKVVGELVISGKTIFKNIGLDYFVMIDRIECINFLEERLQSIDDTYFVLDNKLNNLVRTLKVSYPVLSKELKISVDDNINKNNLRAIFDSNLLIERNIQTGDLMPSGVINDDDEKDYVFNESYGTAENEIMDIIEQIDEDDNVISSKLEASDKSASKEIKYGKNYKKNKKKRDKAKAKKRLLKLQDDKANDSSKNNDEFYEMLEDMGIINQTHVKGKSLGSEIIENKIPENLPIIKEVDIKDIKILGPQINKDSGQIEVPEYLKYNDPNKPAINPNDIMEYSDLVNALETIDINESDSDIVDNDDAVVTDIVETELLPADIEYDYEKLNKYFVENEEEIVDLKFDEDDLFDEAEFDIKILLAKTKKESLQDKLDNFLTENKSSAQFVDKLNKINSAERKSILKTVSSYPSKFKTSSEKNVTFASSLEIKEVESTKMFNRKNTFVNMSYYMNMHEPVIIDFDVATQRNTDFNKISLLSNNLIKEEELLTEALDIADINNILKETANKLTGGDDLLNDEIKETSSSVESSEKKEKVSRFKKDRGSRKSKRNSLILSEMSEFAISDMIVENGDTSIESLNAENEFAVYENEFVTEDVDTGLIEDEGNESFNTLYQKSLHIENNFFTKDELEEGRDYTQNIFLEQEEEYDDDFGEEDDYDLGPVEEHEFEKNFEAKKKVKEQAEAEERMLNEMVDSEYEFPEELIKAINEDKDIEVIQEPKIDYSQLRTTDEMAEAYMLGLYDDDREEFSAKHYQRVEGLPIDYSDDTHKGYIIEKLSDFEGYNEQVEILKDDISEFIKETTAITEIEGGEDEDESEEVMIDVFENSIDFSESKSNNSDVNIEDDDVNYFAFNDDSDYRLSEDVLKEDISKEYQRLKQKIIKKQQLEAATSDIVEHESRQFEPIDESGNVIKKSRFKQQRIKMNL